MAFSLNKIMLIGVLGKEPETRFTTTNVGITTLSLATTHSYKGKDGNWINETDWHKVVLFNLSDFNKQNLHKGSKVYLEGRLSNRSYTDDAGVKKYITEIVADSISLIILDKQVSNQPMGQELTHTDSVNSQDDDGQDLPF